MIIVNGVKVSNSNTTYHVLDKELLVIDKSVMELCKRPYYNHKNGCPNYNKNPSCPPKTKLITEFLDFEEPIYVFYNCFNLKGHVDVLKKKHPNWTNRQLYCCLYWQNKARKQIKDVMDSFVKFLKSKNDRYRFNTWFSLKPEAHGVNVTATMNNLGIRLEWPPINYAYQVGLVGVYVEEGK